MRSIATCSDDDTEMLIELKLCKEAPKQTLCQRFFPTGFKRELKSILEIAFPCVLTGVFRYLNPVISLIMCGHLNKIKFDAASLANSLINILGVCIDGGFSTAFDTLFAQIFGCNQKKKMGFLLQRAMIIMTLLFLVLACIHINILPILIGLQQKPEIAELAAKYISIYLPGLFFDFQFVTISRYLQNQNIVYPMMISSFIGDVFSAISQYVAIYVYGYDLEASAIIQGVACFIMFAIQLGYILISKVYVDTWDGFSLKAAFSNWKIIFVYGLPGILMISLETWNFEVGTLIAGTLSEVQLGAQSIAFQCAVLAAMVSVGFGVAGAIRIGQYLGSRDLDKIKTCLSTMVVIGMCSSMTLFVVIFSLRHYIAQLFSNDLEIQEEGANLLIFIASYQFIDIIICISIGVLRACGRQATGAVIMFICYYIFGIPLGVVLVYVVKMNILGFWIGLITALFLEGIVFLTLISRTDWEKEFNKANENVDNVQNMSLLDNRNESEEAPLLAKSDMENSNQWTNSIYCEDLTTIRKGKQRRATSYNENAMVMAYRRKTIFLEIPVIYDMETEESFKRIIIKRCITIAAVVSLFIGAFLLRTYLPRSLYFPVTNNTFVHVFGQ